MRRDMGILLGTDITRISDLGCSATARNGNNRLPVRSVM
ncbi:hypothetical protein CU044_2897 [Streptomyces sp. L-9-10]|nr:hypothetical protein CU044_2897 [Streptomyces sp. L-9-10]